MRTIKCQCPEKSIVTPDREYLYSPEERGGINHDPNKCGGTNEIKKYLRGDKELYLCSCCVLLGDKLITNPPERK